MREVATTTIAYQTLDGKTFHSKSWALEHEDDLRKHNVKAFKIYNNDHTPCSTSAPKFVGYVLVNAKEKHEMFVENYCYNAFGAKVTFIGAFKFSDRLVEKWFTEPCSLSDVRPDGPVLATINDGRCQNIF